MWAWMRRYGDRWDGFVATNGIKLIAGNGDLTVVDNKLS